MARKDETDGRGGNRSGKKRRLGSESCKKRKSKKGDGYPVGCGGQQEGKGDVVLTHWCQE